MAATVQDMIMLLGDSITQGGWEPHGFAQQLAYVYNRKLDVINRGMSGYNTEWIIPVLEQCFAKKNERTNLPNIRLLTIWLGANDAAQLPTRQHVPLDKYRANLRTLVRTVTSPDSPRYSPEARVLLLTPPPMSETMWARRQAAKVPPRMLDRKFDVTKAYAEAVREVAGELGVHVVDVWTAIWERADEKEERLAEYLSDGLHLTENGYKVVFEILMKAITTHFPEMDPDKLQPVFSYFDQIDDDDPRSSLQRRDAFGI
ncbi:SGNH hydrolase-type esterase domain-containing protein [Rhodofomes roseus]|uniref:SGNH hydrolase-type esterase domain-containing protein n=1 Tax=Rhodofomes roseus TaxID=34475 RepID=A0ABQ8KI20_9APHY|nr:SGNH hydrolase-type esterase domain-containing protein [Rhodofomes roseus]KAH9837603.1 SGNH hydrolase-type esterase domain-containing protein [Rhodofomes roseus]